MHKKTAIIVTLVVAVAAIAGPIALTLQQARKQSFDLQTAHILGYARDVVQRTDATADQLYAGIERLVAAKAAQPCSEESMELMRAIDLGSSYIQAIGYVSDERLMCSSLGKHGSGLALGPVDLVLRSGASIRYNVSFPTTSGISHIVIERFGYAAIVHKTLPIDATTAESDVSLATFTATNREFLASRGFVKRQWAEAIGDRQDATFVDSEYVVAVVRSAKYNTGGIAALPIRYVDRRARELAAILVPVGLLGGIVLALAVLYLARLQLAMPAVIRAALRRNEFFLNYQPVVELSTGKWVGVEALIRWRRPSGEMVRPDIFIQAAEDSGLIERVTERVIDLVRRDAADLFSRYPQFHIAINLSSADLKSGRTLGLIRRLAADLNAGPHNIIVEATERGFMHADAARKVIEQFRGAGIRVAIDDFGTGYSSLSYLESFQIDFLKIDKSFVDTIGMDAATSQVVPHIIEMAKALNLGMVAEGVEKEPQAQYLRDHGVQYAQGWLFGKPMSFADLSAALAKRS
jgi:sensor c-di-GMP phosphodiesterase-like protein